DPGDGSCVNVTALQASVTVSSPVKSGIVSKQLVPAPSERLVAQSAKTGGVSSTTVRITDHEALKLFVSVTVRTTPLVPSGKRLPAKGFCVITKGLQSVATIWPVRSGVTAAQFVPALNVMLVGPAE